MPSFAEWMVLVCAALAGLLLRAWFVADRLRDENAELRERTEP